ncbi:hypothetical protein FGO68_gene10733 [Halteria grandinella]|uniref:Uncharacterized protein n=1 Tax=Halteria grandinella TaxID=5974 RepID=A0A8J8NPN6_HALGN|nr:hypothetical protein FGO68_gene10733 [Halteria grandinella]
MEAMEVDEQSSLAEVPSGRKAGSYFLKSIGSTLPTLQYFTLGRASTLLNSLSRQSRQFLSIQKNNLFGSCSPTVFNMNIQHVVTIKGNTDRFIVKMVYLGTGHRFLVLYASCDLELKDFANPANPITEVSIQLGEDLSYPIDLDFHEDESKVIVGFVGSQCAFVDMKSKVVQFFDNRLPEPLKCVLALRHLPRVANFFILTRGGTYRARDFNDKYQDIAKIWSEPSL